MNMTDERPRDNFLHVLLKISNEIADEQFKDMKFLLQYDVSQQYREKCETARDLFCHLMDKGCFRFDDTKFLEDVLERLGCSPSVQKLQEYREKWKRELKEIDLTGNNKCDHVHSVVEQLTKTYKNKFTLPSSPKITEEITSFMVEDGGQGEEIIDNLDDKFGQIVQKLHESQTRQHVDGSVNSISSNKATSKSAFAKRIALEWAMGKIKTLSLVFYIESKRVTQDDMVEVIFDQLLSKDVGCSRAELGHYIGQNQHSVLFVIDGVDEDKTNPTCRTAHDVYKTIKESSLYKNCPVVFTSD